VTDVVVFDGTCRLCARSVQFILAHESAPTLRFASVQSRAGARLMREFGFDPADASTFVLVSDGRCHVQSDAALRVARFLRMPWRLLRGLRLVPRALRDAVYDAVARSRYRWFGRLDACMVPTPSVAARFLDE